MRVRLLLPGIGGFGALVISACGSGTAATTAPSAAPQTPVASAAPATATSTAAPAAGVTLGVGHTSLGSFIVDGKGVSLYLFEADKGAKSTCYGDCATNWPPLVTSGGVAVSGGASMSLVGTTKRTDGTTEVTYNGHPLYYFVGDSKRGDTNGEGVVAFGAGWDVIAPSGMKIEKSG
ncbi:MAG: hypothetical protein E6I33_00830 [Chloroflexi bacterium]|nr:MAG: hypothetical protein E6I33_00830 [Chloroflexota bacterium]